MPRRSQASLSLVTTRVDGRPNHLTPPDDLAPEHRQIFLDVVGAMPPEHFKAGDVPLLMRFVEAIAMTERAGKEMENSGGPVVDGVVNPWFRVQEKSARMVAVLATRLRVSPQSRRGRSTGALRRQSAYDSMELSGDDDDR